ncbi:MAG TPA: CoA ester lyase [Anaerolineae bacterium]|nr:CoA ester lyase [Anaerolineae bacterium]
MTRVRRALLYMPGDDMRKIGKAATLDVDCVCLDLEDGTALNRKQAARETIVQALRTLDFGRSERLVRINPVGSGMEVDDLAATIDGRPDGYVLPKVESAEEVEWLCWRLTGAEQARGWPLGSTNVLAIVETARGIINLRDISGCDRRLVALIFGAEDLAGDLGATRTREGWEVFYARSAVVTHAAAFDLQVIDMVCIDFRDTEALIRESLEGARMGFTGKQIIHPNQVEPVQAAFTPSDEAIAHARRIVEAFEAHQAEGAGAFALDGKMVDMPVVKAAQKVLEKAKAAEKV